MQTVTTDLTKKDVNYIERQTAGKFIVRMGSWRFFIVRS